ncbi:hypothetical protein SAMN05421677_10614 [Halobacillus aidingensis]|uniref:Uncharacterized protein n=1 Tax=Halobacillus aidingensis TaxID=240303 RepID=A0A1H0KGW7_HALAD|nr:hypothetical protein SAMN05421677_10614 [Halobacillus aidingensis]
MILTYFIAVALFWLLGLFIWKNFYTTKKGER